MSHPTDTDASAPDPIEAAVNDTIAADPDLCRRLAMAAPAPPPGTQAGVLDVAALAIKYGPLLVDIVRTVIDKLKASGIFDRTAADADGGIRPV